MWGSNLLTTLSTNLIKERGKNELEQLKPVCLKIKKWHQRMITEEILKTICQQSYTYQKRPTKVTPVIDFRCEPVIQCDISVIENIFVDYWQIIDKNYCEQSLMRIFECTIFELILCIVLVY